MAGVGVRAARRERWLFGTEGEASLSAPLDCEESQEPTGVAGVHVHRRPGKRIVVGNIGSGKRLEHTVIGLRSTSPRASPPRPHRARS